MKPAIRANIQKLIEAKGWSWYRLSKQSGVSLNSVYNIGNREHGPSTNTMIKIANALGSTVDELIQPESEESVK